MFNFQFTFHFVPTTFPKVITNYRKLLLLQHTFLHGECVDLSQGQPLLIFGTKPNERELKCSSSQGFDNLDQLHHGHFYFSQRERGGKKMVRVKIITPHFHATFQWEKQQTAFLNFAVMVELILQPNSCLILHAGPARSSLFHPCTYLICGLCERDKRNS